ncbi:hypothetical protein ACFS2C_03295 [Prauserella oleivorans]|uniref:Uncharacterized protein n=1 Tax=Prauserella oleivorans TaxID=1478153 RepID=A0ABW5W7C1_9PSEU
MSVFAQTGYGIRLEWPGSTGPLRPCVEDHLGAGAVVAALFDGRAGTPAPEAVLAARAVEAAGTDVPALVTDSVSGRELRAHGEACVLQRAGAVNVSALAPRLVEGTYRNV